MDNQIQYTQFLMGMTNGIIITARTSLRELCGREHVVMGMVYLGGARAMGLVSGTGIGGLLAMPALHYPTVFSPTGLFARYPFLLPNFFGALFAAMTLPLVVFWYPETKGLDERRGNGEFKRLATEAASDGQNKPTDGGSFETNFNAVGNGETNYVKDDIEQGKCGVHERSEGMQDRLILRLFFLGCTVQPLAFLLQAIRGTMIGRIPPYYPKQMMLVGFDEVFPLWMLSTQEVGGLGWNTKQIGKLVLTTGVLLGMIQLTVLPRIIRFFGIVRWYRIGWVLTVVAFLLIPNAKKLSWNSPSLFATCVLGSLTIYCCSSAVLIAMTVASINSFPPQHRGKLSGLYNTAENLGRFIGPVGYSTIYAMSISYSSRGGEAEDESQISWLDHHLVFYASAVMLTLLAGVGWSALTSDVLEKPATEESQ